MALLLILLLGVVRGTLGGLFSFLTCFGVLAVGSLFLILRLVLLRRLGLLLLGYLGVQLFEFVHLGHDIGGFDGRIGVLGLGLLLFDLCVEPLPYLVNFVRHVLELFVGEPWFGLRELSNLLYVGVQCFNCCLLKFVLLLVPAFAIFKLREFLLQLLVLSCIN